MARTPAEKPSKASGMFSTRIPVLIKVEMTTHTPRVIWAHEKPILEELHGEDNVQEVSLEKLDEGYTDKVSPALLLHNKKQDRTMPPSQTLGIGFVFLGDAASEYSRLVDAYGKHPDIDMSIVEKVYGRYQSGQFERLLAKPQMQDLPDQQLRALIAEYGYPGDIGKDATPQEKADHAQKVRELRDLPTEGLLALAEEVGVEI